MLWCDRCRTKLKNYNSGGYVFLTYRDMLHMADCSGWVRVRTKDGYIASYCIKCATLIEEDGRQRQQTRKTNKH